MNAPRLFPLLVGLILFPVWAQEAPYDERYETAYRLYMEGSEGDKKSTKTALGQLETLSAENAEDPLALVFLGSTRTLMGRDAWLPWNKLSHTEDGLAEMNKALKMLRPEHDQWHFDDLPVSIQVKSLAGITFTQVPDFFGYFEQGYQLLLETSQDPLLNDVPAENHSYIHYYAALAAERAEEPDRHRRLLQRLAELPVEDEFTIKARNALAEASN